MNKPRFFILILILVMVCGLWVWNRNMKNSYIPKEKLISKPLDNMPVPPFPVELVYEYTRITKAVPKEYIDWEKKLKSEPWYIEALEKVKDTTETGKYIYRGSDKEMSCSVSTDERYFYHDGTKLYFVSGLSFDESGKRKYSFTTEDNKKLPSNMIISDELYKLTLNVPLLGIYQPNHFIFFYSKLKYDNAGRIILEYPRGTKFKYNSNGQISAIDAIEISYKFNNYKYFKDIDMTIPTEISRTIYRLKAYPIKKFESKSEKITLVSARKISNKDIDFANVKKPSETIIVNDFTDNNSVTYEYNQKMGSIADVSKVKDKEKRQQEKDVKGNQSILPIIVKVISGLFVIMIIYSIILRVKNEKKK